jgi:outer membrane protein assembly complex protein YaeT
VRPPPSGRPAAAGLVALLALVAGGAAVGAGDAAAQDELLGALKRVEAVRIEGNQAISSGTIKKVLKTHGPSFLGLRGAPLFRPDFLRSDVQSIETLYLRRGYLDASASAVADSGSRPGRVVVVYRVEEGPQVTVRSVTLDSSRVFTDEERRAVLVLEPGDPYDPVQVVLDRGSLGAIYGDRGHFPTIESTVDRDSHQVDIRYVVHDGPAYRLDQIVVGGVERVDTSAVRREVLFEPGDLYRRNRALESSERLASTGLFTTIEVEPEALDSLAATVDLRVKVRERKPRWLEAGIGTGTLDRVRLQGKWGHRNLSGDGKSLTATTDLGWRGQTGPVLRLRYRGELSYVEPWLFAGRTRGRIAASAERVAEKFADITYVQEAAQLSFGASRDFVRSRSRVSLVFENTWARVSRIIEPDTVAVGEIPLPRYRPSLTLGYDQDRRDDPLSPRRGTLTSATLQIAGIRQNSGRFWKVEGMSAGHVPLGTRSSVGLRVRSGLIKPVGAGPGGPLDILARVPLTDRYRVGGTTSVRGYHDNGIDAGGVGGALVVVINGEFRTRLAGPLGGHVFVDGGNVWRDASRFRFASLYRTSGIDGSYGYDDMHWSYGAGMSLRTPVGPVRFDYARRVHLDESDLVAGRRAERGLFHFAIGFNF